VRRVSEKSSLKLVAEQIRTPRYLIVSTQGKWISLRSKVTGFIKLFGPIIKQCDFFALNVKQIEAPILHHASSVTLKLKQKPE